MSLNSALFGCFEKKKFWVESRNINMNFSTFSVGGCWGQPMLLFWKLVDETQLVKPPEPTSHHISKKYLILVPFKSIYFRSLYYETPCTMKLSDLPRLLKPVHKCYLCTGFTEVLNNFGRSDDVSEKMMMSYSCIHGFMPNLHNKSWIVSRLSI